MTLREDRSRPAEGWDEDDVTPRGVNPGHRISNYDLRLFYEQGQQHRGVLVVRVEAALNFLSASDLRERMLDLQMHPRRSDELEGADYAASRLREQQADAREELQRQLRAGEITREEAEREPLVPVDWTEEQRTHFRNAFRYYTAHIWSDKFRVKTDHAVPDIDDVGVKFEVSTRGGPGAHFQLYLINFGDDEFFRSGVRRAAGRADSSWYHGRDNEGIYDRADVPGEDGPDGGQIVVTHEFGHMIGLPDEYCNRETRGGRTVWVPAGPTHWVTDTQSLMHMGTRVRPRHYAPFADWLQRKARERLSLHPDAGSIEYYVQGDDGRRWTISNAGIYDSDPAVSYATRPY